MTALPPNNKTLTPTVRRSVALITAAIILGSTARAEVNIGRLPSTSVTGGQQLTPAPNVFLVIDNNKSMVIQTPLNKTPGAGDVNFLREVARGLRESTKPLIGKVRLGFTTTKRVFDSNEPRYTCADMKLDSASESKYDRFGSGWGQLVPHRFDEDYYNFFSGWLGSMCALLGDEEQNTSYWGTEKGRYPTGRSGYAPTKLPFTWPNNINNYYSNGNGLTVTNSPILDIYTVIVSMIADRDTLFDIHDRFARGNLENRIKNNESDYYKDKSKKEQKGRRKVYDYNNFPVAGGERAYHPYAPIDTADGYPKDEGALSCRQNYAIIISASPTSGDDWFAPTGKRTKQSLTLPDGKTYNPDDPDYGYIYKTGLDGSDNIGNMRISSAAWFAYTRDLQPNMDNDVPAYKHDGVQRSGKDGKPIPEYWDRKNDPATWQHLTTFAIGYTNALPAWRQARDAYNKRTDISPTENSELEGYFRAIESGDIYKNNKSEYFWESRGHNCSVENSWGKYSINCFGDKEGNLTESDARKKLIEKMSYVFNPAQSNIKCDKTEIMPIANEYTKIDENHCRIYVGHEAVKRDGTINTPKYSLVNSYVKNNDFFYQTDLLRAGMIGRGGSYAVDNADSLKHALNAIVDRIEKAMIQAVSGTGTIGGGGRVTASLQAAGGNNSALFTTYLDEEFASGNIFAYKNCPLTPEKIKNENGVFVINPEWEKQKCGTRLWNAATALDDGARSIANKTIFPALKSNGSLEQKSFNWQNLDDDAKAAFKLNSSDSDDLAQARVEWINGKLHADFTPALQAKLRQRPKIAIPLEGKQTRYKLDENGDPVPDTDGNLTLAEATNLTNRMGDIVYATAKAVDPRGTLKASHPLNDTNYTNFIKTHIREVTSDNKVIEYRDPLVLAGSNDGRLYGFTNPKNERYAKLAFSYIPRAVITDKRLAETTKADWPTSQKSLVNGPFTVMDAQVGGTWGTYVVGTLGAGGSTVYALDISNGSATFKWEVNLDAGAANIMAEPRIVWLRKKCEGTTCPIDGKWVVLLPSGYNAADTSLVVLDLADGSELARIKTGAQYVGKEGKCKLSPNGNTKLSADITLPNQGGVGCDNGLGPLTVTDIDNDGGADYVYAGDLLGHIWKFDLTGFYNGGMQSSDLNTALKVDYEGRPLFIAEAQDGTRQPITGMIEIGDGAYGEGSMLYFGTGRLFNQEERNLKQRQSFYAVWDVPRYYANTGAMHADLPLKRTGSTDYAFLRYEPFKLEKTALDAASILQEDRYKEIRGMRRVDVLGKNDATEIAYRSLNLSGNAAQDAEGNQIGGKVMGWILDFPADTPRERVIDRARIFENTVFLSSYEPQEGGAAESCSPQKGSIGGDGRFYMLDRLTGAQPGTPPFDFNRDGQRNDGDGAKVDVGKLGNTAGTTLAGQTGEVSVAVAGIKISSSANFTELEGELERGSRANCDYTRQVIFPGTVDPDSGNPLTLSGCYQNRYRVWKQPVQE